MTAMRLEWGITILAHPTRDAGPGLSEPFAIAAAVALIVALGVAAGTGGRWALWGGLVASVLLAGAAVAVPRLDGEPAPPVTVLFVRPSQDARLPAGEPVTVRVTVQGGRVATSPTDEAGGHLHLYVDGELEQMPDSEVTEVTLSPGPHLLRVEYVDHDHISFEPAISASIEVTAA